MRITKIPAKLLHLEFPMYRKKAAADQNEFIDSHMKFGGELNLENRWIRLALLIP